MSVLYSLTLRTYYTRSRTGKRNATLKILFLLLISGFSFQGTSAQDEKEIQNRKETELKKQEALQTEAKLQANPKLRERLQLQLP